MIARHAKLREVTRRRHSDGSVSHHASLIADGVDVTFILTLAEYEAADRAIATGSRLVLSITDAVQS